MLYKHIKYDTKRSSVAGEWYAIQDIRHDLQWISISISGFHGECLHLAKQLQELTRDAEARAIAKIIMCPQLHKKITFYETK